MLLISLIHTQICVSRQTFFSGQKFVAHFSTTLFFFPNFFSYFLGVPQGDAYNRVWVCVCAKDKHGCQTPEVLAKNQENHHRHTWGKSYELPRQKAAEIVTHMTEREEIWISRGWLSPTVVGRVLLIDYCFTSLRKSQENGESDAFSGHPFRTLRARLTFTCFSFFPFSFPRFPPGEMSHKYDLYRHTYTTNESTYNCVYKSDIKSVYFFFFAPAY